MPVDAPVTRSRASAMGNLLTTLDALLVEVEQSAPAVVALLQLRVRFTVVEAPELVALVVGGRVERLAPAELLDHPLDAAIMRAVQPTADHGNGGPEAEVDIRRLRVQGVEVLTGPGVALVQRAQPEGRDPDLADEELAEVSRPLNRHLDVLDNALESPPAKPLEPAHGAIAALELDELPVVPRSEPALGNDATHARILHSECAGAPEPVGVPPPQIVPNGQMVDATPLDRAIVDVHAGVVAGGGRLVCERAERQIEL